MLATSENWGMGLAGISVFWSSQGEAAQHGDDEFLLLFVTPDSWPSARCYYTLSTRIVIIHLEVGCSCVRRSR